MLSDRSYMRSDYPRPGAQVLTWLLSALLAGFVLQNVVARWFSSSAFETLLALSPSLLKQGYAWTLVTYTLLQPGVLTLLFTGLAIFMLGRELLPLLGARRFVAVYIAAAITGGLLWLGVQAFTGAGGQLIGATGCALALFILFACFYPDREITFLLFFVLPVTIKPKYLAWGLVGLDGLGFLFSELPNTGFGGLSHSAHLGGMLTAWVYFRFFHANNGWDRASGIELPAWLRRRKKTGAPALATKVNIGKPPARQLRAEVDRILDKINSEGFGSLTAEEKRVLDEAKDLLSRS